MNESSAATFSALEQLQARQIAALEAENEELRSRARGGLGREGMVTVWDEQGRYVGCMGVELWRHLLTVEAT